MKSQKLTRWTIEQAASEWDINPRTLSKRLKLAGIEAVEGGYSTKQIDAAIHGDMDGQKLRETTHRANLLAMDELERARELMPKARAMQLWGEVITLTREKIMSLPVLTEEQRREIVGQLRVIPEEEYFQTDKAAIDLEEETASTE